MQHPITSVRIVEGFYVAGVDCFLEVVCFIEKYMTVSCREASFNLFYPKPIGSRPLKPAMIIWGTLGLHIPHY